MKTEFGSGISSLNTKLDNINSSIKTLKAENEQLKHENAGMKIKLGLYRKIDTLEDHSRRKHLRINSIPRKLNELWKETEAKVRTFIRRDLDRPDLEDVEIERAHRVKSLDPNKCNIVVKFSKYKDRDQILSVGKQSLKKSILFRSRRLY